MDQWDREPRALIYQAALDVDWSVCRQNDIASKRPDCRHHPRGVGPVRQQSSGWRVLPKDTWKLDRIWREAQVVFRAARKTCGPRQVRWVEMEDLVAPVSQFAA